MNNLTTSNGFSMNQSIKNSIVSQDSIYLTQELAEQVVGLADKLVKHIDSYVTEMEQGSSKAPTSALIVSSNLYNIKQLAEGKLYSYENNVRVPFVGGKQDICGKKVLLAKSNVANDDGFSVDGIVCREKLTISGLTDSLDRFVAFSKQVFCEDKYSDLESIVLEIKFVISGDFL